MRPFRPVFFTGGSALKSLARELERRQLPATHLVTTFDSGGSSAKLRKAFAMPAVGDLRNRLAALASPYATPAALEFFEKRLPDVSSSQTLLAFLKSSADPKHALWQNFSSEEARLFQTALNFFMKITTPAFDPTGASMGNLVLAALYLKHGRDFFPPLAIFASLWRMKGSLAPIVAENLNLAVKLTNGEIISGEHHFKNLPAPVSDLFLTVHEPDGIRPDIACRPPLSDRVRDQIIDAPLICFPMGSFYSSLLATLLPAGVGKAVAQSNAARVFIPNTGHDPENAGMTIIEQVNALLKVLRLDAPEARSEQLLHCVLVDETRASYPGGVTREIKARLKDMGIRVINRPIVFGNDAAHHAPENLIRALQEIAAQS